MTDLTHDLGNHDLWVPDRRTADRVFTQCALVVLRYRDDKDTTSGGYQACDDLIEHLRALARKWGVTIMTKLGEKQS